MLPSLDWLGLDLDTTPHHLIFHGLHTCNHGSDFCIPGTASKRTIHLHPGRLTEYVATKNEVHRRWGKNPTREFACFKLREGPGLGKRLRNFEEPTWNLKIAPLEDDLFSGSMWVSSRAFSGPRRPAALPSMNVGP